MAARARPPPPPLAAPVALLAARGDELDDAKAARNMPAGHVNKLHLLRQHSKTRTLTIDDDPRAPGRRRRRRRSDWRPACPDEWGLRWA